MKVKAEVVGSDSKFKKKLKGFWKRVSGFFKKVKFAIAVILDLIDFFIAWIPIVNTSWDIVCFIFLLVILRNKKLAFISLIELPLLGLPPFSIMDMFIPICTIVVALDNQEDKSGFKVHTHNVKNMGRIN